MSRGGLHVPDGRGNFKPDQKTQITLPAMNAMMKGDSMKLHTDRYREKINSHPFDAGLDLFPNGTFTIHPYVRGTEVRIGTGLHICFEPGSYGHIMPRSSSAGKLEGMTVTHGLIDAGYTGEILVRAHTSYVSLAGDDNLNSLMTFLEDTLKKMANDQIAIAQVVMSPYMLFHGVTPWDENHPAIAASGRKGNGFGSTDIKV